jgi:hypothetical protein
MRGISVQFYHKQTEYMNLNIRTYSWETFCIFYHLIE